MSKPAQSLTLARLSGSVLLLALTSPATNADTIYVFWDGSGDYLTIQQGIDAAQDGDEVVICSGTYHEIIDFNDKAIAVRGEGATTTVIDGAGLGESVGRTGGVIGLACIVARAV